MRLRGAVLGGFVCAVTAGGILALACSGSASTNLFNGSDDGAPPSDAPIDALPGEGGPPSNDTRIDPLEIGRSWVFNVASLDGGPPVPGGCAPGVATSSVIGPGATIDGSATVRYQPLCDTFLVDALVQGDRVTAYPVDSGVAPGVILDAPVEEGHTWTFSSGGATFVWHDAGTVTVPAGTFPSCWARAYVAQSQARFVYCRGVGLVQVDDTDFGYRAVLTSKNF